MSPLTVISLLPPVGNRLWINFVMKVCYPSNNLWYARENACQELFSYFSPSLCLLRKHLLYTPSWIDVLMRWELELCMLVFPISRLAFIDEKRGDCEWGKPRYPQGCLAWKIVAKLSTLILRWALVERLLFAFMVSWWDLTHEIFAVMGRVATTS